MSSTTNANNTVDPFGLKRFIKAQDNCYLQALSEIRNGKKQSHWMWYIFPQIDGLGSSAISRRYSPVFRNLVPCLSSFLIDFIRENVIPGHLSNWEMNDEASDKIQCA